MDSDFPFSTSLTLDKLVSYWEQKQNESGAGGAYARSLMKDVSKHPELQGRIRNIDTLSQHQELIRGLMSIVFPEAVSEDMIQAAFEPFSMEYFFGSKKFNEIVGKAGCIGNMVHESTIDQMKHTKIVSAYQSILSAFYGVEFPRHQNFPLSLREENGLAKHYHLTLNPKFCDIKLKGKLPELSDREVNELVDKLTDLEFVMKKLPPRLFEFEGFGIYTMIDATNEEVISKIKESLLKKDSLALQSSFLELQDNFRSLLGLPDLLIGLTPHQKRKHKMGTTVNRSLLTDAEYNLVEPFFNISQKILRSGEPYIVKNVDEDPIFRPYKKELSADIRSMILSPLLMGDELVGILEIASPRVGAFNTLTFTRLGEITPLFSIAVKRHQEELENRVQSIIKENYTSIHPTVEWRFTDAAFKILEEEENGLKPNPEEIVFKNVYPIYAASDIRNSSVLRNEAITDDLTTQLKLAKEVLSHAEDHGDFPLVGELIFRIKQAMGNLKKGLVSGDESSIMLFIKDEVEPVIRSLEQEEHAFFSISKKYWDKMDPELKVVYKKRKAFEESLTTINDTISRILNHEQEKAQKVFPHFFEKYKTDGIEYNAYIGSSITRTKKFDPLHLKNLRLWQLMVTVEIARKTMQMKSELAVPLETTHLVLVHNQPLSVSFRMDEKQFDVDGAYNIRYEIVKKRIDKVRIKDSRERLTQPGKIAIVFSGSEDTAEYIRYLEFLQFRGLIGQEIERLELEELQGVIGLKALRVSVEPGQESFMHELENLKKASLA